MLLKIKTLKEWSKISKILKEKNSRKFPIIFLNRSKLKIFPDIQKY